MSMLIGLNALELLEAIPSSTSGKCAHARRIYKLALRSDSFFTLYDLSLFKYKTETLIYRTPLGDYLVDARVNKNKKELKKR